jgi:uncharacterized protein (DUF4415 family)
MKRTSPPEDVDVTVREATADEFKKAKSFEATFPKAHASWKSSRGRSRDVPPRVNKTLRLDARLVAAMAASGAYSARAEQALWQEFIGNK